MFSAAFNFDYNALDGGERSAIAKGYEDVLSVSYIMRQRRTLKLPDRKDIGFQLSKTSVLFRASWDYLPIRLLKLIKWLPTHPWMRMRSLQNLYREYGKQILQEHGPIVDTEKVSSKDIMSILGEGC